MGIVIAVDPSIVSAGFAVFKNNVLVDTLLIKPKTLNRKLEIVLKLNGLFCKVFSGYSGEEITLAIETQYIALKNSAVLKTSEVKGIVEGAFLNWFNSGKILEVSPTEAKKAMGMIHRLKRKESKKFILDAVQKIYPQIASQDIADSVAIGICAIKKTLQS